MARWNEFSQKWKISFFKHFRLQLTYTDPNLYFKDEMNDFILHFSWITVQFTRHATRSELKFMIQHNPVLYIISGATQNRSRSHVPWIRLYQNFYERKMLKTLFSNLYTISYIIKFAVKDTTLIACLKDIMSIWAIFWSGSR